MPNWCYNRVTVFGESSQVEKVLCFMQKALKEAPNHKASRPNRWIGQFVVMAGENWEQHACRGWIEEIDTTVTIKDERTGYFEIQFDSAWEPQMDAVDIAIKAALRGEECIDVDYVFVAEEPGEGIYINTDECGMFYNERYIVDFDYSEDNGEGGVEYFETLDETLQFFNELTGLSVKTLAEAQAVDDDRFEYIIIDEYLPEDLYSA